MCQHVCTDTEKPLRLVNDEISRGRNKFLPVRTGKYSHGHCTHIRSRYVHFFVCVKSQQFARDFSTATSTEPGRGDGMGWEKAERWCGGSDFCFPILSSPPSLRSPPSFFPSCALAMLLPVLPVSPLSRAGARRRPAGTRRRTALAHRALQQQQKNTYCYISATALSQSYYYLHTKPSIM